MSIARRHSRLWALSALLMLVLGLAILLVINNPFSASSETDRINQTALGYAQQQIAWSSSPSIRSTRILALRDLGPALATAVPRTVAHDVNVPDLERRYGAGTRVGLVVLSGVFNSLPPDEGVITHGDVVVVVTVRHNQAIFLTD